MEQLATQCPHCGTQFRVTLAQLELRDGRVRCGSCREVFNGIDTVFEYTGMLWVPLWGFLFFQEIPRWTTVAGTLIIIAAGIFAVRNARN